MIKSFNHKGLKRFYEAGTKAGIRPAHAAKLARQLARLAHAKAPADVNIPGWNLHLLKGELAGHWAISVSGNWRLIFVFSDGDVFKVDYSDYH